MRNFFARFRVLFTALPTYLVLASTAVTVGAAQLSTLLPAYAASIAKYSAPVLAALAVAVAIVRSVVTVLPEHRNLLTNVPYAPVPEVVPGDARTP